MATAKQIAWRKQFAKMAKSGAFKKKATAHKNPARKRRKAPPKVAVNAPSRATHKKPSPRLKARRAANTRPGVYPNPRPKRTQVCVYTATGALIAQFANRKLAMEYARALATKTGKQFQVG